MTGQEAIAYIHAQHWQQRAPGLGRMRRLLRLLDNPQDKLRFVHVAGTNGKGSVCACLASVLRAAGYRVGLCTSPFLEDFRERIQVDGELISPEDLGALTEQVRPVAEAMPDHPTEFELITAVAMLYFRQCRCDIVVLEVGMGGELDSTNVIDVPRGGGDRRYGPGPRPGAGPHHGRHRPGQGRHHQIRRRRGQLRRQQRGGPGVRAGLPGAGRRLHQPDFSAIVPGSFSLEGQSFSYGDLKDLRIPLAGEYQMKNAAVVLETVKVLQARGWRVTEEHIRRGLANTRWPAGSRCCKRTRCSSWTAATTPTASGPRPRAWERLFPGRKFTFVTGVMADKDVESILGLIVPLADQFFTVRPDNPRAMSADELARRISAMGVKATACDSVAHGVQRAIQAEGPDGVAVALGSLYMSGRCGRASAALEQCLSRS